MSKIYSICVNRIIKKFCRIIVISIFCLLTILSIYIPFSQNKWGLKAQYYQNIEWNGKPVIEKIEKTPYIKGEAQENILAVNEFSVRWRGYLVIKESNTFRFTLNSDDGSYLRINDDVVIDNGGIHGLQKRSKEIPLERGIYPIEILYFQVGGYNILELFWSLPKENAVFIPHKLLFATKPTWIGVYYRDLILLAPRILPLVWLIFLISIGTYFFISTIKKTSVKNLLQNLGLSIISLTVFLGMAELLSRIKYTPQAIDYKWIFEYDKDKIFRLKANHKGEYGGVEIITNSYGYRDNEIPIKKSIDNIRILTLGDSITFGHGDALQNELYSEVLEAKLNQHFPSHKTDVINLGCPGNSAQQEFFDLKKGLQFQPDIVIVQFTLNDVTEPYLVSKKRGGEGKDYHGVEDIPYYDYILSQRSAFYLFFKDMVNRATFQAITKEELQKKALEREVFNVLDNLVTYQDHPKIKQAWNEYFVWLKKIITLCNENKIKCILLISPYSFQLELDESFAYPQNILKQFAKDNQIVSIDLLSILQQEFKEKMLRKYPLPNNISYKDFTAYIKEHGKENFDQFWNLYFVDVDHYSVKGHQYVAQILYQTMIEQKLDNLYK